MSDGLEDVRVRLAQLKSQGGPLIDAHTHCANHRSEVENSDLAGCFYCCSTFASSRIEDWIDDNEGTAMCPNCGIDSVIGDASGFPVSDADFLSQMHKVWF